MSNPARAAGSAITQYGYLVRDMDEADFQRAAEMDGFKVSRAEMMPGRVTPEHDHAWDIRGMVLEGRFAVEVGGWLTSYGPGEVFEVPGGVAHSERHDPEGGMLLVGRRQVDATS